MRAVERNSTVIPGILDKYRGAKKEWNHLLKQDRKILRNALREEFAGLCGYCEGTPHEHQNDPGPIEHFRPRNPLTRTQEQLFGTDSTFDPLNILYCCAQCQESKGNWWPGTLPTDLEDLLNDDLRENAKKAGWEFVPVPPEIGYVCPNADQPIPAENFFKFHKNGRMVPNESLGSEERSRALRTIHDLGLNDPDLIKRRRNHLQTIKRFLKPKGLMKSNSQHSIIREKHQHPKYVIPTGLAIRVQFTRYILSAFDEQWI